MLTDLKLKALPRPKKRREIPDGRVAGLYLVHQASGAMSWALRYRFDGASRKLTIGRCPPITIAAARRRATEALGDIAGGKDPAAAKQASKAKAKAEREADSDHIERVIALFVERHLRPRTRSWRRAERLLVNEVASRWRGKRLSLVTRAHVHDLLDEIIDRGSPIQANRVFSQFRAMCRWAVGRGIIERSPTEGLTAPSPETRRERVLSDDEIKLAMKSFSIAGWPFGAVGQLLVLTGQRRNEVARMRWDEVDFAGRLWKLPGSRSKNKRDHEVPLSDAALRILDGVPRIGESGFVFSVRGGAPISGFSKFKGQIDRAIVEMMREEAAGRGADPQKVRPPEHWTLHDLRRTTATGLQKLGVRLEVTEAILNHISGSRAGITGIYQRHTWSEEKRSAVTLWAEHVAAILHGEPAVRNVIEIAQARA
jgi:integrase